MSDVGIYAAVQAEIISALSSPTIATDVLPSMSMDNLIQKDNLRTPSIGIIFLGTTNAVPYAVGSRLVRATSKWRVAIAATNLRGTPFAREDVYPLLEKVRNQLHFYQSAQSPKTKFLFQEDYCPDSQPEGKITAYADFTLDLILGK